MANGGIKLKALVVDDSRAALEAVAKQLQDFGSFDVFGFETAEEAFEHAEEVDDFSVFVIDVNLTGSSMNGLTLASQIRHTLDRSTPVLFISGDDDEGLQKKIRRMGDGYAFLKKPFSAEQLYDTCIALVNSSRQLAKIESMQCLLKKAVKAWEERPPLSSEELKQAIHEEQTSICEAKSVEILKAAEVKAETKAETVIDNKIKEAVRPSSLIDAFKNSAQFKIIVSLLAVLIAGFVAWQGVTHKTTMGNKEKLIVVEERQRTIQQVIINLRDLPDQMKAQNTKIDSILTKMKPKPSSGNP